MCSQYAFKKLKTAASGVQLSSVLSSLCMKDFDATGHEIQFSELVL